MTNAATTTTTCPPFSAGGEHCPWCGRHVGEYGWMREHSPLKQGERTGSYWPMPK